MLHSYNACFNKLDTAARIATTPFWHVDGIQSLSHDRDPKNTTKLTSIVCSVHNSACRVQSFKLRSQALFVFPRVFLASLSLVLSLAQAGQRTSKDHRLSALCTQNQSNQYSLHLFVVSLEPRSSTHYRPWPQPFMIEVCKLRSPRSVKHDKISSCKHLRL